MNYDLAASSKEVYSHVEVIFLTEKFVSGLFQSCKMPDFSIFSN